MSRAVIEPSLMSLPVTNLAAVALPPPTTVATTAAARIDLFMRESSLDFEMRAAASGVATALKRSTTVRQKGPAVDRSSVEKPPVTSSGVVRRRTQPVRSRSRIDSSSIAAGAGPPPKAGRGAPEGPGARRGGGGG